jgi:hypothetical protein
MEEKVIMEKVILNSDEVVSALSINERMKLSYNEMNRSIFPDDSNDIVIKNYYKAAFELYCEVKVQESLWWFNLRKRYSDIPNNASLNLETMQIYYIKNPT